MLNQTSIESKNCAHYVENYLDFVENLPDDVQRYLSRMHELDISYRGYLKDVEVYKDILKEDNFESSAQRKILCKLEQVLILLQEVGDEKVEIGQQIIDLIDNKYRQLDQNLRNTEVFKEQEDTESVKPISHMKDITGKEAVQSGSASGNGSNNGNGGNIGHDRGNKRPRRSRTDTSTECSNAGEMSNAGNGEAARIGSQTRKQSSNGGKKKKRKARQQQVEDNPPALLVNNALREELQHDVDEPTYCLCDQISYGEMILCDNDLCPIEWFHFVCVSLTSKPKGKWFCPKCRGDRANVMKPKSQFLKELERYNKEKEEKS